MCEGVFQSLEWQVSQRSQEVQVAQEQLALAERRQADEMDSMRRALQVGDQLLSVFPQFCWCASVLQLLV